MNFFPAFSSHRSPSWQQCKIYDVTVGNRAQSPSIFLFCSYSAVYNNLYVYKKNSFFELMEEPYKTEISLKDKRTSTFGGEAVKISSAASPNVPSSASSASKSDWILDELFGFSC